MPSIELAADLPGPVAYVLAGGASYGSVQVGQLRALAKTDITPDFVVGTSVGSLNGAIVAEDPQLAADRLSALWSSITSSDVFGKAFKAGVNLATRQPWVVDSAPLADLIERSVHARDFTELKIPLTAVATDFQTGDAVPIREGDLPSALLASAAIPGIFPSVERDGRRLVDGGLVANIPMGIAAAQGAQTIVVLDCGFTVVAPERDDTWLGALLRAAAIMAAQQVRREFEACADRTVLYLPGPWPIGALPNDFSRSQEIASDAFDLTLAWLTDLHPSGPGRYGAAPVDELSAKPVK